MFLSIYANRSGEETVIKTNGKIQIETLVKQWVDESYCGELKVAESDGYIPNGCGEYYAEIRRDKIANGSCLSSMNFFLVPI